MSIRYSVESDRTYILRARAGALSYMEKLCGQKRLRNLGGQKPLTVSVIIVTHSEERFPKLKRILSSLAAQTYPHVEVIVIGNGVTTVEHAYLSRWAEEAEGRRFLPFSDNVWSYEDHSAVGRLRYQAGVDLAAGELVFCQSDDDFVAPDFFERMVDLFVSNPECKTAIGLPLSYYWDDDSVVYPENGAWKHRPRYMHGKDLVLNWIKDGSFHPNPGFCFVTRKELFQSIGDDIWYGYDTSVLLFLVPQGITGFDSAALMYWGRHDNQAHFEFNRRHYRDFIYLNTIKIRDRIATDIWKKIGSREELNVITTHLKRELVNYSAQGFFTMLEEGRYMLALKHLRLCGLSKASIAEIGRRVCSMLRGSIKHVVRRILSVKRFRMRLESIFIRFLRQNRFHHVRHANDAGIDVTFIEYKHVAVPPDRRLVNIAVTAARMLCIEGEGTASSDELPKDFCSLFDFGNHYLLLTELAKARQAKNIVEIGMADGASLWSWLRAECVNKVYSWYLQPLEDSYNWSVLGNCKKMVQDVLEHESSRWTQYVEDLHAHEVWEARSSLIAAADIIFVNGPHDGFFERKLLSRIISLSNLKDILLVFNKIRISTMVGFWNSLSLPKLDITFIGHQSGTGIALLDKKYSNLHDSSSRLPTYSGSA